MIRNVMLVAVGLALAVGCENRAEREQSKAENAQQNAAEQSNQANQKIANAQREAQEQQGKANDTLVKERNDIHADAQKRLGDIDKKMTELRDRTANVNAKTGKGLEIDTARRDAESKRGAVNDDMQRLDNATAQNVDQVKDTLNRDIDQLNKSVNEWSDKSKGVTRTTSGQMQGPSDNSPKDKTGKDITPSHGDSTGRDVHGNPPDNK